MSDLLKRRLLAKVAHFNAVITVPPFQWLVYDRAQNMQAKFLMDDVFSRICNAFHLDSPNLGLIANFQRKRLNRFWERWMTRNREGTFFISMSSLSLYLGLVELLDEIEISWT